MGGNAAGGFPQRGACDVQEHGGAANLTACGHSLDPSLAERPLPGRRRQRSAGTQTRHPGTEPTPMMRPVIQQPTALHTKMCRARRQLQPQQRRVIFCARSHRQRHFSLPQEVAKPLACQRLGPCRRRYGVFGAVGDGATSPPPKTSCIHRSKRDSSAFVRLVLVGPISRAAITFPSGPDMPSPRT